MKQVCWHSRRSKADRGLPDAETAFEVNMSTRGKAKFGKRHGSRKWEEENSATRRRHRGKGEETAENPSSPPYNVPHTPLGIRAGCFLYFVFLKRGKYIRSHFVVVFGIRSGPSQGFSRIRRGIRRHLRVHWQICESKWLVFRTLPCNVAAQAMIDGVAVGHCGALQKYCCLSKLRQFWQKKVTAESP